MTEQHPITPPPELVEQWLTEIWHEGTPVRVAASDLHIATQAARWGADQELEACCEWVEDECPGYGAPYEKLRAVRRPKPPSLAKQALTITGYPIDFWSEDEVKTIRRALERLQELENNG